MTLKSLKRRLSELRNQQCVLLAELECVTRELMDNIDNPARRADVVEALLSIHNNRVARVKVAREIGELEHG